MIDAEKTLDNIIEKIQIIDADDIPSIDLYMDQVTTFMDSHLGNNKRFEDDKVLTKTMINNYAKNDLLPAPKKKRYTKDHVIMLTYIYYMKNFLSTLYKCYKELDKRFATVNGKKISKKERIEQTVLGSILPISKAEICQLLPDVSPTTVEAVLGQMTKDGRITKLGQARATKYVNAKYIK